MPKIARHHDTRPLPTQQPTKEHHNKLVPQQAQVQSQPPEIARHGQYRHDPQNSCSQYSKQCSNSTTGQQRNQPTAKALRGLPEIVRLENAAASAFENQDPIILQQLANLRYQQCKHLPQALQEIQAGYKQTCWAWWAFPSDRTGKSEPRLNGLVTCLSETTALSLIDQPPQDWRPVLEEIADTGWQTLLPTVDHA